MDQAISVGYGVKLKPLPAPFDGAADVTQPGEDAMAAQAIYPIIYVRGFAGGTSGIDSAVDDPFYGFNSGATHVRINGAGQPQFYQFEGPLVRLIEEQADGTTVLTFHETYHAYNPVLRFLLERPVHAKISRDNLDTYQHALGFAGTVTRLT